MRRRTLAALRGCALIGVLCDSAPHSGAVQKKEDAAMKLLERLKNVWDRWLARLAQANEEEFGGRPPSCCGHGSLKRVKH